MKFTINIEETINQEFEVEASSAEEAMDIAEKMYDDCEFVLDSPHLTAKQMAIVEPDEEVTEWTNF